MPKVTNQLGLLLVESGFLTDEQIEKAQERAAASGVTLGRILAASNDIEEKTLNQTLEVLIHLRDNAMFTEADALEVLGMMKAEAEGKIKDADKNQLKSFFSRKGSPMRVGELLVRSGLVSESDVISAVEEGLLTRRKVGQVLVSNAYISVDALEMALNLLDGIKSGELDASQAAKNLREAHTYPESDDDDNK